MEETFVIRVDSRGDGGYDNGGEPSFMLLLIIYL